MFLSSTPKHCQLVLSNLGKSTKKNAFIFRVLPSLWNHLKPYKTLLLISRLDKHKIVFPIRPMILKKVFLEVLFDLSILDHKEHVIFLIL